MIHALDIGLVHRTFEGLIGIHPQAIAQTRPGLLLHDLVQTLTCRHLKVWHVVRAHGNFNVASFGNDQGVFDRRGVIVKQLSHFVAVFYVEAPSVEAKAFLVGEVRRGAHAQERVVMLVITILEIVGVVGRNQGNIHIAGHLDQLGVDQVLVRDAVALQLQVKAILKQTAKLFGDLPGPVHLPVHDGPGNRS